jgi:hypothetical protein
MHIVSIPQFQKVDIVILWRLWSRIPFRPTWAGAALCLIFGLAVVFRVYNLGGRDLWTDEAWVALAALEDTPGAALTAGQSTPPWYLLTVWALVKIAGGSEAVLRSLSLIFGLGTLILFWPLARRLASRTAALLGLALVAFSPVMVYYSKELKQYSGDAFFAVLILFLLERVRERESRWAWAALAAAGVLGLGFSHALIFTLPVALAVLWFTPKTGRSRALLLGGIWAGAFGAYYFLFFRGQVDPGLLAYWAQDFPDFSGLGPFLRWLGASFQRYFHYFFGDLGMFWAMPAVVAGGLALKRQKSGRVLLYLAGPVILTLVAAALHRYPFMGHYCGSRLMLFSAPLLFLTAAAGGTAVFTHLWRRRLHVAALALSGFLLLSFPPGELIKEGLYSRNFREEIQPLVAHLQSQLKPQDWIYVYHYAVFPFKYYFRGSRDRISWGESCVETDLAVGSPGRQAPRRLWLIAAHMPRLQEMRGFAYNLLGPQWRETSCLTRVGAVLFCFERTRTQVAKNRTFPAKPGKSSPSTPSADKACK